MWNQFVFGGNEPRSVMEGIYCTRPSPRIRCLSFGLRFCFFFSCCERLPAREPRRIAIPLIPGAITRDVRL